VIRPLATALTLLSCTMAWADGTRLPAPPGRQVLELQLEGRRIPVVLLVPSERPTERGFPLVVSIHGQSVDGVRECDHNWRPQAGIVIACPTEASTPWRTEYGERLVLGTVRELLTRYRLDPDRVFLGGASTGGIGAWRIAFRRPDRFAGVIPRAGMPPMWSDAQLSNLLSMGAYVVHGATDTTIRPEADRRACERLHELGGDVVLRELDGAHSSFPDESRAIAAWIVRRRRDPAPRSFRYALARNVAPLPDRVHWLELSGRSGLPVSIEARVDRAAGRVEIRFVEGYVENVRVLLDDRLVDTARPVTVVIDGQESFRGVLPAADAELRARLIAATGDPGVGFDRSIAVELPVPEVRHDRTPPRRRAAHRRHRRRRHR
jgi:pimeloyl-ACP methyl ester carboxylesterase